MSHRRALLSVYDKTDLAEFAAGLSGQGFELIATGGTAEVLRRAGLPVTDLRLLTGSPELLGGRVKSLHPVIHAGILSRRSEEDEAELEAQGIGPIDVVVCNLYPFEAAAARGPAGEGEARDGRDEVLDPIDQIDIGGVTLLRAAAKNHAHVTVVPHPSFYDEVLGALVIGDGLSALNRRLAREVFRLTARYDRAVSSWLEGGEQLHLSFTRVASLRYGENPHQAAALYRSPDQAPGFRQVGGDEALSYNNLVDMDAGRALVAEFGRPTVAIIKHTNPCGVASADSLVEALGPALACDPVSAFGSVIAVNRSLDLATLEALGELFVEVIVAPSFAPEALARLAATRTRCRLIEAPVEQDAGRRFRQIHGGLLVQDADLEPLDEGGWQIASARSPSASERVALRFAWRVAKHVTSNAIVLARGEATVGVGAGQTSRVGAVELAGRRAGARARGAVLASDAFFPFPDGVEAAAQVGVTALIQPGGSIRDAQVRAAVDRLGLAMITTGRRHFRH